jgi:TrmH family RNA methyltransferase
MVAVVESLRHSVSAVLRPDATLVVALAAARDPGNAGAVIRVADAVGADGVLASPDSVDIGNAKVVRASVGSVFHLPVVEDVPIADAVARARALGMQVLAADGSGTPLGGDIDLASPTLWVFGNEAWGLPDDILALADRVVALPIYGKAESLNLATAAAVLLYASAGAQAASR